MRVKLVEELICDQPCNVRLFTSPASLVRLCVENRIEAAVPALLVVLSAYPGYFENLLIIFFVD